MSAQTSADLRPGAPAPRPGFPPPSSLEYTAQSAVGSIRKSIAIQPGALVEFHGHVKILAAAGQEILEFALEGSSGRRQAVTLPTTAVGNWASFHLPPYRVAHNDATVDLVVSHGNASAGSLRMLLDDFEVRISNFWEHDNLVNLDFEEPLVRMSPSIPDGNQAPDYWLAFGCRSSMDVTNLPSGTNGQRAARLDIIDQKGTLMKRFHFLAPGQQVDFSGKVRSVLGAGNRSTQLFAFVGEGTEYHLINHGNNVRQQLATGGGWQPFSLSYTVPGAPDKRDYTALVLTGGLRGDTLFVDDVEVTIR